MQRPAIFVVAVSIVMSPGIAGAVQCNGTSANFPDHIVAFADQPPAWQSDILSLDFPNDLPPAAPAPSLPGDAKSRYLTPNHPGTQPMPPDSAWCHYTGVNVPAGQRVPSQVE